MLEGKKLHFVVPRYHTNMVPWVKALQENGAVVSMDVLVRGRTEDHTLIEPVIWEDGTISAFINKFRKEEGVNKPFTFPSIRVYWRYLKELNPDVVVVRDPSRYFSRLVMLCTAFLPCQLVLYNQAPLWGKTTKIRRWIVYFINVCFKAKWMTPVYGETKPGHETLPRHYFVPFTANWVGRQKVYDKVEFNILSIGKFEERKEHLTLIQALIQLGDIIPNWRLTWVGELSSEVHKEWHKIVIDFVEKQGLANKVFITLNVKPVQMPKFYQEADLFILPSKREPASISVIEALAFGLPVICSNENGTRCYIRDLENGKIFQAGNVSSLQNAIMTIYHEVLNREQGFFANAQSVSKQIISNDNFLESFKRMLS